MLGQTPKFDALIGKILDELVPHTRVCADCGKDFNIEKEDITFFKMFKVPAPKLCPNCRQRRRLSFANYSNIYKRKCDVPGHTDTMISLVAPVMPWVTYDFDAYNSDTWSPVSYGIDFKNNTPVFSQFLELLKVVPQPGVRRGANSPNSDFSFYGKDMKDCYYVFGGRRSEDVMYSSSIYDSRHVYDCYFVRRVDTSYGSVRTVDSFNIKYAYFSSNCIESSFIFDCRNCQNCFGCVNLRNKNYCFFNQQLSREEYLEKMKDIDLGSQSLVKEYEDKFWNFVKENPIRATRISQSNNCTGDDIVESNNCHDCFQLEKCENVRYSSFAIVKMKDSMDVGFSGAAERQYDSQNTGNKSANVKFCFALKESNDCEYSMSMKNCNNCFGCIGLQNTSYSIFNKQYSPEEYFIALDEVKTKMLEDGEYGEFFPMNFAPYAYNSSFAHIIYPMDKSAALDRGLYWQDDTEVDTKNIKTISVDKLPDNIDDVTEELFNTAIIGEKSGKPFKILKREVEFYKQKRIPPPTDTPYQRILNRLSVLNNFQTYKENCVSCGKNIDSTYRTVDGYKPMCESCYQKEVL